MMTSAIIHGMNLKKKNLSKFFHVNSRKSHKILDHFGKSIKSYIKMIEAAALLGSH